MLIAKPLWARQRKNYKIENEIIYN